MYKKIDKWNYDLQINYLNREIKWWDVNASIVEQLQKIDEFYNLRSCFDLEFTPDELREIANDNWSNALLYSKIEKCAKDKKINASTFAQYQALIAQYYQDNIVTSKNKSEEIQEIARIWLYSDGIEENSPFDLLIDLEKINDVIFEKELTYEWYNNFDIGSYLDDEFEWNSPINWMNKYGYYSQNNNLPYAPVEKQPIRPILPAEKNIYACNINDSWLSNETFDNLIGKNNSGSTSGSGNNAWGNTWWEDADSQKPDDYLQYVGNYSPLNDNALWPCNNFFCITIDVISYRQNLLKWGTTLAIETLIKRSNEHIGKFTNTSLVPAVMTTNNFELWFRDLNLPDLFHIWVQVTTKPVPFLNLDKNGSNEGRDETQYASKNLLSDYYANLGLDYQRANDLRLYELKDEELKTLLMSSELSVTRSSSNYQDLQNYRALWAIENQFLSNSVQEKIEFDDLEEFQMQFTELEKFSQSMMQYSQNLWSLAQKMSEKEKK